jgi:hypothetical protein
MSRFILPVLRALLLCLLLPIVGFAGALAATGGNDSPLAVEPALMVATMFLSSLAGAATLSLRIMTELKANADAGEASKPLLHPWIYCISHMLGSWCAGAFGFVFAMQQQAGAWWLLGTVLVLSFGGAKALERIADSWSLKVKP